MSDQSGAPSGQANVQAVRRPLLVTVAVHSLIVLTIVIQSVVAAAQTQSMRRVIGPPQRLLPGSPLPEEWTCPRTGDGHLICDIHQEGKDVYVTYDVKQHRIVQTVISASEYTIGDLILAWGTPTFFAQNGRAIDVYWGTRYAYLTTCSFQPGSNVELIAYYLEAHGASRWRGFPSTTGYDCARRSPRP